ncbi:MAG TPA: phosphate ABC transporter permease PstA [Bdellovibrionota bacterium]|nr:phosphate ABC transporter permease PstA [Bdellovibrionota bacterium]
MANQFEMEREMRAEQPGRRITNVLMCSALAFAAFVAIIPLVSVFGYVFLKGFSSVSIEFFTSMPKPVGEIGGGMANALAGTGILVGLAGLVGIPWGLAAGVYLSEYVAAGEKGAGLGGSAIRFAIDMLASIPSIIVGLFVYVLVVMPFKHFSAWAGGLALGILMIPTVARTTEELLKMVPVHVREAGLALGLPRWKVIVHIVLKGSLRPISTGIVLAIARVSGETAPLLFTAFGNQYWSHDLSAPIASLPVQIYTYAVSPFDEWHRQAWAGALVLILFVSSLNLLTRVIIKPSGRAGA